MNVYQHVVMTALAIVVLAVMVNVLERALVIVAVDVDPLVRVLVVRNVLLGAVVRAKEDVIHNAEATGQ